MSLHVSVTDTGHESRACERPDTEIRNEKRSFWEKVAADAGRAPLRIAEHDDSAPSDGAQRRVTLACRKCGEDVGEFVAWWAFCWLKEDWKFRDSRASVYDVGPSCWGCFVVAYNTPNSQPRMSKDDLLLETFDREFVLRKFPYTADWCKHCDRMYLKNGSKRSSKQIAACSPTCEYELRKSARRVSVQTRQCAGCRNEFTPMRADGQFCSSAWRQRVYRKRKATL